MDWKLGGNATLVVQIPKICEERIPHFTNTAPGLGYLTKEVLSSCFAVWLFLSKYT